jgi:hypothetical protein
MGSYTVVYDICVLYPATLDKIPDESHVHKP